jgi:hypothetical protein
MTMKLPSALPRLRGRWLTAYRVLWVLLFVWGLFVVTWGGWMDKAQGDRATAAINGVGLTINISGFEPLGAAATAAGVTIKSELVAIDGQAATWTPIGRPDAINRLEGPTGSTVTVRLRSADGAVRDFVLTRSPEHLRAAEAGAPMPWAARSMLYWAMSVLESALILVTLALMFWRRPDDPVAALFSMGALGGMLYSSVALLAPTTLGLDIANGIGNVSVFCIFIALLVFPSGRFDSRWTWIGGALTVVWVVLATLRDGQPNSVVLPALSVALMGICVLAIGQRYFKAAPGMERQQIKWTLLGLVVFAVMFLLSFGIELAGNASDDARVRMVSLIASRVLSSLGSTALFAGLLMSILRHRLYDADLAISRSVSAGALTLAVVAIFAGAEKAIEIFGEQYLGGSAGSMAGAIAAGLAAALILPLHHGLSRWTEGRFQGALVRMRKRLPHDMDEMRDADTVACLADTAMRQIMAGVRAGRGAVLVQEAGRWTVVAQSEGGVADWWPGTGAGLVVDKQDEVWPLRLALPAGGVTVGWLLLGPRPDGTLPNKDEREALEDIADPVGRAIRVAQRREAEAVSTRRRFDRLETTVRQLKRHLAVSQTPVPAK